MIATGPTNRRSARLALAQWGTIALLLTAAHGAAAKPSAEGSLVQILDGAADPLRRESAALALGTIGNRGALPVLLRHLTDDANLWVRARCAEALGLLGDRSASAPLRGALSREKNQRLRRAIGEALLRLGERRGLGELLWQLSSGNNHTKAEVMKFLVRLTGRPLGEDTDAWWRYFSHPLKHELGRPLGGAIELRGVPADQTAGAATIGPRLQAGEAAPAWSQLCVQRIRLRTPDGRVTQQLLEQTPAVRTVLEGCLLLIQLELVPSTAAPPPAPSSAAGTPPAPTRPGLTAGAAKFLIRTYPKLAGVALAAAKATPATAAAATRRQLVERGWLIVDQLGLPDKRLPDVFRLLLVRQRGADRTLLLALLD